MQPQVRYVKSSDGTRLAVSTLGQGQPFVIVPGGWDVGLEGHWETPEVRENLERLAERRMVTMYDHRGVGLSSRDVEDLSHAACVLDLKAVIDGLGFTKVDLFANAFSAPITIDFAAHHPDRVLKLVLMSAVARGRDFRPPRELRSLRSLVEENWELYIQTQSLILFGWTELGRHWSERTVSDVSRDFYLQFWERFRNSDVSELLPLITCPTLVMHWRDRDIPIEVSRELATAIPHARLSTFSQVGRVSLSADWDSAFAPIVAFLDEDINPAETQPPPEGTALILFADIAGSTALTESLGDAAFRAKARDLDTALRAIIRESSGNAIEGKLLGDGVLAVFASARQAIEAARACGEAGNREGLPLHLGIHAGDVIREDKNVYGGAVNIAARIAAASAPGELLVSDTVRSLARTSAGVTFADRGEQTLKGVADPVRVFAVT